MWVAEPFKTRSVIITRGIKQEMSLLPYKFYKVMSMTRGEYFEHNLKLGYLDEYPELKAEEWEEAMDALGHNVTSHIAESGECPRCAALYALFEQTITIHTT